MIILLIENNKHKEAFDMYYRKNKFGESVIVEKYECGSCRNYEFLREDRDNYCNHYCHYYHYKDHCKNYWEMSHDVSGGGGCFLTTACCQYKGLPDDCNELRCLRAFRDNVLLKSEGGYLLVQEYYQIAPEIVEKIGAHEMKAEILESIYHNIKVIEKLIIKGNNSQAIDEYVQMVSRVKKIVEI